MTSGSLWEGILEIADDVIDVTLVRRHFETLETDAENLLVARPKDAEDLFQNLVFNTIDLSSTTQSDFRLLFVF